MTDEELLRAHEPILRFTHGELFLPADAERYISECDLFMGRSQRESRLVAPVGTLTPERLASLEPDPGQRFSLRFVQRPLSGVEMARWWRRPDRPTFRAAGRLARVGLFARIIDAGFNVVAARARHRARRDRGRRAGQVRAPPVRRDPPGATTAASSAGTAGSCSSTCSSTP